MILTTLALALPILTTGQSLDDLRKALRDMDQVILEQHRPAFERAARELPELIAEARRRGLPLTADDIPQPPARLNGALLVFPPQERIMKLGPLAEAFNRARLEDSARSWEGDPFLAALEEALSMPEWHIPRAWERGHYVFFPEAAVMKSAAKALGERAVARAKAGRRADSLRDLRLIGELAERVGREHTGTAIPLSASVSAMQEDTARRLLRVWWSSPASRSALRQALLSTRTSLDFESAHMGDLLVCLSVARSEQTLGGLWAIMSNEFGWTALGTEASDQAGAWPRELIPRTLVGRAMASRALQAFLQSGPPSAQAMDKVRSVLFRQMTSGDFAAGPFTTVLGRPAFVEIETNLAARRRLTDAAFFLAENPGHTGPLPQVDPWSGEPLKRAMKGRKASIWSVGPDGKSAGPFFAPRQRDDADDHSIVIDLPAAQP
jgi:hypothetical protein